MKSMNAESSMHGEDEVHHDEGIRIPVLDSGGDIQDSPGDEKQRLDDDEHPVADNPADAFWPRVSCAAITSLTFCTGACSFLNGSGKRGLLMPDPFKRTISHFY
jgi:hypothetical protein